MWRPLVRQIPAVPRGVRRLTGEVVSQLLPSTGLVLDLGCGEGMDAGLVLAGTNCTVLGLDCDPASGPHFSRLQAEFGDHRFLGSVARVSEVAGELRRHGLGPRAAAVLLSLGPGRSQLEDAARGLDLRTDGPLDGRYCRAVGTATMQQVLATMQLDVITVVLKKYGGVVRAKAIASQVVELRYLMEGLDTTQQLLDLLVRVHEGRGAGVWDDQGWSREANMDRAFMALRRFVNDEVNETVFSIQLAETILEPGGLLVCHVSSDFDENLLKTTVFRRSGSAGGPAGQEDEYGLPWKMVLNHREESQSVLVFERCIQSRV